MFLLAMQNIRSPVLQGSNVPVLHPVGHSKRVGLSFSKDSCFILTNETSGNVENILSRNCAKFSKELNYRLFPGSFLCHLFREQ